MGTKQIEEIILKVSIDDSGASTNLTKYESAAQKTTNTNKSLLGGFRSFKGVLAGLGLAKAAQEAFDIAVQYDKIRQSLKTVTGSQSAANKEFDFLNEIADDLGVTLPSIAEGYTKLFSALKGAGIAGKVTRELTEGVAELSTAMGLSESDTSGLTRALSQIASKGRVSTEELQQLAERGVDSFGIASRAIGVTTKELTKMLEQGKIISSDFLPKFGEQLRKEFGGAAKDASQSAQANINRLKNEWARSLDGMGSAITKFVPILTSMLSGFNSFRESTGGLINDLNEVRLALLGIDSVTDENKEAKFLIAQRKINIERKKNAKEVAKERAELEKLSTTRKNLEAINKVGLDLIFAENLQDIREELKLTTLEFERLSPAILDALSKGVDTSKIKESLRQTVSAFKAELNEVTEQESFKGAFDELIQDALTLKNALNMKVILGLNDDEFKKIGKKALAAASASGLSTEQLKQQVELLRQLGTFEGADTAKPELAGTTFEAGTAAATEFLKQNEIDMERNKKLDQIAKNTKNMTKTSIVVK